jgi:hypothetical protein
MSVEIHQILDPGLDKIQDGKHPDIGDAINLRGCAVQVSERLAAKMGEIAALSR